MYVCLYVTNFHLKNLDPKKIIATLQGQGESKQCIPSKQHALIRSVLRLGHRYSLCPKSRSTGGPSTSWRPGQPAFRFADILTK